MPKTKIIATLGPSSSTETQLGKMFRAGLDVVRLNFSHGNHTEHIKRINIVRRLNKKTRRAIKIMQDLEGYRIRIGKLREPIELKKRAQVHLTQEDMTGRDRLIPFDYKGPLRGIKKGTLIYIDDGRIVLKVRAFKDGPIRTEVMSGGILKQRKGINIPDLKLKFDALTDKDRQDLEIAVKYNLDYIAQSFVRTARDVVALREILRSQGSNCMVFAKIESKDALLNIDRIIDEAEGIIVARGDLGVCVPIQKVPIIQKEIIKKTRRKGKPAVVATQMLDSMTEEIIPTRAEATDVANAILDGATHLLLSAETATGTHPSKVVEMMNEIIKQTEEYQK